MGHGCAIHVPVWRSQLLWPRGRFSPSHSGTASVTGPPVFTPAPPSVVCAGDVDTLCPPGRVAAERSYVLIPYATTDGRIESPSHDTPAYRAEVQSWFEALQMPWCWVPTTLACLAQTLAAVCAPGQTAPALVCNLCDGDEVHGYPGVSVVRALEQASIPFTGAASTFYALSTSKIAMKERLRQCRIATPPFVCLGNRPDEMARLTTQVGYPAMIKPAVSAASTGISLRSCVHDAASARAPVHAPRTG